MQVFIYEKRLVSVRRAAKERIERCAKEGRCVACLEKTHPNERTIRGMHMRCYFATGRAIKSGRTTEAERIQEGKMLEAQPGGRKPVNPVTLDVSE